ncbi:MAG: HEAT repeat domain-containing protein [Anaerolineales bacterium]|uniref:HEAT repeat domain-containing protein n=1 Tax=Candidatus Villigracilis vicinus TaxID=3140679 RepID=UPI003135895A|nr:HEAT repeat domain-containing protein [Anaerolineales bacterium]
MAWFANPKQAEAKRWIPLLADSAKRDRAAQELIRFGADAVPALMDALQSQDLNLLAIYQQILARIPAASPELMKAFKFAHPIIRGRVADIFGMSKDKHATPALLEALQGEFFTVKARAALALANIGDPQVIHELLPLLQDPEDEVRIAACTAIGKFRDPSTFDELANVTLDDPIIDVRQAAVRALGDSHSPAAIPFLMEALRDSFWWFEREQAVRILLAAIENMGEPVVEPLIEALGDREGTVRKFAAKLLGRLGNPSAIEELGMAVYDLHHEVSQTAAEALAKFGAPAIDVLAEALIHPEASVRKHAVIGLGSIKDERVVPYLIEMLQDSDREVKTQAIQALADMKDTRALPALQQIVTNRADREMASFAKEVIARLQK